MLHGSPGRTFVVAGLALAICLVAGRPGLPGTEAGETGAPRSAADLYRPEDAARVFAGAARAVVKLPSGRSIVAEIADTPEREMYGYMFRREVKETEGMVFVYPEAGQHAFWMKNTLVPLDIIWMDDAKTVVYIESNTPPCKADPCPSFGPMRKTSAVLEVRAGTTAVQGLKVGDRLRITVPQSGD